MTTDPTLETLRSLEASLRQLFADLGVPADEAVELRADELAAVLDDRVAASHEALRAKLAEVERERDEAVSRSERVSSFAATLIGNACERHSAEIAVMGFHEFQQGQPKSCHWCCEADRDRLAAEVELRDRQIAYLNGQVARQADEIAKERHLRVRAEADRDRIAAEIGERRLCVNCGRTKPVSEDRHGPLPECTGPDGHAACTFDMTPQEAWEHWRGEAHRLAAEVERLRAALAEAPRTRPAGHPSPSPARSTSRRK